MEKPNEYFVDKSLIFQFRKCILRYLLYFFLIQFKKKKWRRPITGVEILISAPSVGHLGDTIVNVFLSLVFAHLDQAASSCNLSFFFFFYNNKLFLL